VRACLTWHSAYVNYPHQSLEHRPGLIDGVFEGGKTRVSAQATFILNTAPLEVKLVLHWKSINLILKNDSCLHRNRNWKLSGILTDLSPLTHAGQALNCWYARFSNSRDIAQLAFVWARISVEGKNSKYEGDIVGIEDGLLRFMLVRANANRGVFFRTFLLVFTVSVNEGRRSIRARTNFILVRCSHKRTYRH